MEDIREVITSDGLIIKYLFDKLNKGYNISLNQEEIDLLYSLLKSNGYDLERLTIPEIYEKHSEKIHGIEEHIYLKDDKIYPTHSFGKLDLEITNFSYLDEDNIRTINNIITNYLSTKPKRVIDIRCDVNEERRRVVVEAVDMYLDLMKEQKNLRGLKDFRRKLINDMSILYSLDETLRVSSLCKFPLAKSNYLAIIRPFEEELKYIKTDVDITFPKRRLTIYDEKQGNCYYFKD